MPLQTTQADTHNDSGQKPQHWTQTKAGRKRMAEIQHERAAANTVAKTNGGGVPVTVPAKRENRGRGVTAELRRAIIKALRAAAINGDSGTKIAKQFGVSTSTVYGIRDEEGLQVLQRMKKKPTKKPSTGPEFAARRDRMIALYDAGKTAIEVAAIEGCNPSTAYEHHKRWRKLRGIPAAPLPNAHPAASEVVVLASPPLAVSRQRVVTGRSMSAQKAYDLTYDALANKPAGALALHEYYFLIGYKMDKSRDIPD